MTRFAVVLAAVLFLVLPASAAAQAEQITGTVIRAIDGDTIEVSTAGGDLTVRLIGIDTPETKKPGTPVECGGPEASAFMAAYEGEPVTLTTDPSRDREDRFGRLLAYADVAGEDLGLAAIRAGHSDVYVHDGRPFARQPAYEAARDRAADQNVGAWSAETCAGNFHQAGSDPDLDEEGLSQARSESAERFVRRFYFRLNERRFSSAWGMLSSSMRRSFGPYAAWRAGYRTTVGIRINAASVRILGDGRAVVVTRFRARDRDACTGGIRQQFFRARWVLSRRNGSWQASGLTASKVGGDRVRLSKSECPKPKPRPRPRRPAGGGGGGGGGDDDGGGSGCHPSYSPCVPTGRDYDCGELAGPYVVTGSDPYRLDGDGDGIGCE